MPNPTMIPVTFIYGGGTLLPIKGKVSGRHYGYHKAPKRLSILAEDLDSRFEKVGNATSTPSNEPVALVGEVPTPDDDLTLLPHLTSELAATLKEYDAATFERVAEFGIGDMAELLHLPFEQAAEVAEAARAKLVPVVETTPQPAATLPPNKKKGGK